MRRAIVLALLVTACVDLGGLSGASTAGGPGPDADAGATSDAAADAGGEGGACNVLYVSPAGSDAADGCGPASALQTLTNAIAVAKTRGLAAGEIHACQGVYVETLRLDYPVSIIGSFDCSTWKRSAAVGPPSWDLSTVIQAKDGPTTFSVVGAIDRSTRIDGVRINGPTMGELGTALSIDGASPTIIRSHIVGGSTTSATNEAASVGIHVRVGGSPEIRDCSVNGGAGASTSTGVGSIGIRAFGGGDLLVAGCAIDGGRGSTVASAFSSLGIFVKGGKPAVVQDCDITGGTGTAPSSGAAGVFAQGDATVNIIHNTITGGAATATNPGAFTAGVFYNGTGLVDRNRISGGMAPGDPPSESRAVQVQSSSKDLVITNNALHGGIARTGQAAKAQAAGVFMAGAGTTLRYNTIFAGQVGTMAGMASGVVVAPGATDVSIGENLIFGHEGSTGLVYFECSGTTVRAARANAFFSLQVVGRHFTPSSAGGPCDTFADLTTVGQVESTLLTSYPTASVGDDLDLRSSCVLDPTCRVTPQCTTAGAPCIGSVLASWDDPSFGNTTLLGDGFALAPSVTCAVAKPSTVDTFGVTLDLAGLPRTDPKSLGANEHDGACTP